MVADILTMLLLLCLVCAISNVWKYFKKFILTNVEFILGYLMLVSICANVAALTMPSIEDTLPPSSVYTVAHNTLNILCAPLYLFGYVIPQNCFFCLKIVTTYIENLPLSSFGLMDKLFDFIHPWVTSFMALDWIQWQQNFQVILGPLQTWHSCVARYGQVFASEFLNQTQLYTWS